MIEYKPISTPIEVNARLCSTEGRDHENVMMYRQLMGSIIYVTLTRSDISYTIRVVSQFMHKPKKHHLEAAKRILRYVKGTLDYGVLYKKIDEVKVIEYCDVDNTGNYDTHRSTTGYIKRQPIVSLSSTKTEYLATAMAA
ncbi:hypothetical protein M9H77_31993 [Catharanthus roseus]|uniref:Uncharacterized protein n=1 Tax=Catharanthus roseus TaxID=4058 RepID=A0ACC0A221_CATRO|nr:hypothetical protein M9H77_31993 [Catharanthus roseus]